MRLDGDRAVAVPERVADQDVEDLPYRGRGRQYPGQLRIGAVDQPPSARGEQGVPPGAHVVQQGAQVDRGTGETGPPDQADEILDGVAQVLGAGQGVLERGPQVRVGPRERGLQADHERGERRPELVRHVGAERPLAVEELPELTRGVLQGLTRGVGFPDAEPFGPHGEVPVAERPGDVGEALERRGQVHRLPPGEHRRETDGEQGEQRHRRPGSVHAVGDGAVRHGGPDRPDRLLVGRDGHDHGQVDALDAVAHLCSRAARGQGRTGRPRPGHAPACRVVHPEARPRGEPARQADRAAGNGVGHDGRGPRRVALQGGDRSLSGTAAGPRRRAAGRTRSRRARSRS